MCNKSPLRRVYGLMITCPTLASPKCLHVMKNHPPQDELQRLSKKILERHRRDMRVLYPTHFPEVAQLHVVPIDIPFTLMY